MTNSVNYIVPQDVPHQKTKGIFCWWAKVSVLDGAHDVGISIDEAHEFLQTPKAAFAEANEAACQIIVVQFQLTLHVRHYGAYHANDGNDKGAEGHSAQVIEDCIRKADS